MNVAQALEFFGIALNPEASFHSRTTPNMNHFFLGIVAAIVLPITALVTVYLGSAQALPFSPPSDNTTPRSGAGGASRGNFFTPPADNSAPRRAAGGASRGGFFTPPADNPAPRRAAGGAARGDSAEPTITAMMGLMPQSFYGTTVSERPTILVYLPDSEAQEVIFSLKDEASTLQYSVTLPVSGAGVYALQMPPDAPVLEVGKNYHWFAALILDDGLTPGSPFVDGWIKRIEVSAQLSDSLEQGDPLANAAALGAAGVWYDSVAKLASLRSAQPQNEAIAHHWSELLTSVGLQDISMAPLIASSPQR
jgi:Domain of Unknown Function (DUF928)